MKSSSYDIQEDLVQQNTKQSQWDKPKSRWDKIDSTDTTTVAK